MDGVRSEAISLPEVLDHDLGQYFAELRKFESTSELEESEIYRKIKPAVDKIFTLIIYEEFSEAADAANWSLLDTSGFPANDKSNLSARVVAWNLERGAQLDGIIYAFKNNAFLQDRDIFLLSELDYGMARSGNRFVAREIAKELGLNYAFAPIYIALQKGSGLEAEIEGENTNSIHGIALMSRYHFKRLYSVALPNGKDKMSGKEKRLGHLRALIADIGHPAGDIRAVSVHLDAHCSREHRRLQMKLILDFIDRLPDMPTIIGGDWNTTTFNSQNSTRAILGYWRRVFMGPFNVAKNHFPHPDKYFERPLFRMLVDRGFEYEPFNQLGVGTLHYDVKSIEKNKNLADWVPAWCFPFIYWAANSVGGKVSGRLDWFAGRGVSLSPNSEPKTIQNLTDESGKPLSDHDPITVDIIPDKPVNS
jgi:endonuclease/exonuclease/phosphatase family metal-dependent hydrolase